jgi:hypothetical protein
MATIIRGTTIDCDPATAWDALADFGALHTRLAHGFVTDTHLESADIRAVTFFNGAVARERLVGVDEPARRLAYSVIDSGFNAAHHNAAAQVFEAGPRRTRFVWTVDVLPDEVAEPMSRMMDAGLAAIKATLESGGG